MQLDTRDLEILRILSRNGRITKTALAQAIGLSPTPTWDRLKRLEKAGLIERYQAQISLKKLGPHVTVFVTAELSDHTAAKMQIFEDAVRRYDEIVACWALGGGFDYLLQIITTDIDSYQALIDTLLNAQIGLSRYYTYVVTKPVKTGAVPPLDLLAGSQKK